MAKRKGPKHKGIVLIKPNEKRRTGWGARWLDPDSGKTRWVTLPAVLTTVELRADWAAQKAADLQNRQLELATGAVRATATPFDKAIERYFAANPHLRPKTLEVYKATTRKLAKWAAENGIKTTDDLDRAKVLAFRETLLNGPKHTVVKKGKRGERTVSEKRRSPVSINQDIRTTRTVLGYWVDNSLCAHLSFDDLRRLKRLPEGNEEPEFFKPAQLHKLLEACLAHDADKFKMSRREKELGRKGKPGQTKKHDPITPFIAVLLLTGMRFSEALHLDRTQLDLEHAEIRLKASSVKTKKARTVDLSITPACVALLQKLKGNQDKGRIFPMTANEARKGCRRVLKKPYDAPEGFSPQVLRSSCATYLTNAPGIFGAASVYRSARQLGHSVQVAETHYLGLWKHIRKEATTVETAMEVETVLAEVLTAIPHQAAKLQLVAAA